MYYHTHTFIYKYFRNWNVIEKSGSGIRHILCLKDISALRRQQNRLKSRVSGQYLSVVKMFE